MLMTMKVCWIVTQQGAVPTVTVNSTAPFTGTVNPSIPTSGVGTRVILEAFMPIFSWPLLIGCSLGYHHALGSCKPYDPS